MAFNAAGHILALQQRRKPCRRRCAAIAARGITAAGLTAGRGRNARKPNNAIPKPERFAIKYADLRGLSRDRPIRRGRAEKIGWQAKAKDKRRNNRASHTQPGAAKAGTYLPAFEDTSRFTHEARITEFFAMLQLTKM